MRIVSAITAMLIGLASPLGQGGTAIAAEIKILSSNGLKEVLQDLAPEFSRTTGHKLSMVFDVYPNEEQAIASFAEKEQV